ncbi:MAG: hypothetical protein JWM16_5593 [Verrucomicrobiales bacterium]|nr:hypothetical protein [Verrucomicrobiales bacterium]
MNPACTLASVSSTGLRDRGSLASLLHTSAILLVCGLSAFIELPGAIAQTYVANSEPFQRVKAIRIREFTLISSTLLSAVNQLNLAGKTNDALGHGVYILLHDGARLTIEESLTLSLKDTSLADAAKQLCLAAHLKLEAKNKSLMVNTFQSVEVEYLPVINSFLGSLSERQKVADEGWEIFSSTHESAWVGGSNKPERYVDVYCRKKPTVTLYPHPF